MKNTHICPKCGSDDLLEVIPRGKDGNYISAGFMDFVYVQRFVCAACGYNEEWIETPEEIETLRKCCKPVPKKDSDA